MARWSAAPDIQPPMKMPWMTDAACARPGVDPEVFFPLSERHEHVVDYGPAFAICAPCPVKAECLAHAIGSHDISAGVWGGLTPQQVRAAAKMAKAGVAWPW